MVIGGQEGRDQRGGGNRTLRISTICARRSNTSASARLCSSCRSRMMRWYFSSRVLMHSWHRHPSFVHGYVLPVVPPQSPRQPPRPLPVPRKGSARWREACRPACAAHDHPGAADDVLEVCLDQVLWPAYGVPRSPAPHRTATGVNTGAPPTPARDTISLSVRWPAAACAVG